MIQTRSFYSVIIMICYAMLAITEQVDFNESADRTEKYGAESIWCECDLTEEEWPDYYFFTNAQQGHYNLTLESAAAYAVKDYALDSGMENEEWELKRIYYFEDACQAYVESRKGNELYILFTDSQGVFPKYIIMADIRRGNGADVILQEDVYSYNSMLEWHSYKEVSEKDRESSLSYDAAGYLHDVIYNNELIQAIYDYMDMTGRDKEAAWKIDDNYTYIGRNGYIVCAYCSNGVQNIRFLVDVWNKTYAVVE